MKEFRRTAKQWLWSVILVLWIAAPAAAQNRSPALEKLIKAAAAEGELNYLGGGIDDAEAFAAWEKGMKSTYGIDVKLRSTTAPSMPRNASVLMQEFKANKPATTDIFLGSENHLIRLWKASILESVNWKELSQSVPEAAVQPDNAAVAIASRLPGVAYNTRLVAGGDRPRVLNDLLNPKWKKKIASTPYAASFGPAAVILGDEKITKFLNELVKGGNLAGLIGCGDLERIVSGEFVMLALTCGSGETEIIKRKGGAIDHIILEDVPILTYWLVGVPKNSPHPNLAKLFALYLMTEEAQRVLYDRTGFDLHLIEGTSMHKIVQNLRQRGIEPKVFDVKEVAAEGPEVAKWRDKYQKILQGR